MWLESAPIPKVSSAPLTNSLSTPGVDLGVPILVNSLVQVEVGAGVGREREESDREDADGGRELEATSREHDAGHADENSFGGVLR